MLLVCVFFSGCVKKKSYLPLRQRHFFLVRKRREVVKSTRNEEQQQRAMEKSNEQREWKSGWMWTLTVLRALKENVPKGNRRIESKRNNENQIKRRQTSSNNNINLKYTHHYRLHCNRHFWLENMFWLEASTLNVHVIHVFRSGHLSFYHHTELYAFLFGNYRIYGYLGDSDALDCIKQWTES